MTMTKRVIYIYTYPYSSHSKDSTNNSSPSQNAQLQTIFSFKQQLYIYTSESFFCFKKKVILVYVLHSYRYYNVDEI